MTERYRGRPFGWDEVLTPEQLLDHDPYDGPTDWVYGELTVHDAAVGYSWAYTQYRIAGHTVDEKTIQQVGLDPIPFRHPRTATAAPYQS